MALKPWYLCLLCSIFLIVQIIQISTVQNKLTYEVALVCNATWCSYWIHIFYIYVILLFCKPSEENRHNYLPALKLFFLYICISDEINGSPLKWRKQKSNYYWLLLMMKYDYFVQWLAKMYLGDSVLAFKMNTNMTLKFCKVWNEIWW